MSVRRRHARAAPPDAWSRFESLSQDRVLGALLLVAILLVLLLPAGLRHLQGAPALAGTQSYAMLERATLLGTPDATFVPTPYDAIIKAGSSLGALWLLPALVGVALLVSLWALLRPHRGDAQSLVACLVVALSPAFMHAATRLDPTLFAVLLLLWAILARERSILFGVALTLGILCAPTLGLIVAAVFLVRRLRQKDIRRVLPIVAAMAIAGIWALWWSGISTPLEFRIAPSTAFLFEFGVPNGVSIFLLILAGYDAVIAKQRILPILSIIATISLLFLFPGSFPLAASVLIALLASRGLLHLLRTRWELELLRALLLVLLACIGALILITAIRGVVDEQPTARLVSTLTYLGNQDRWQGGVLTDPALGPIVTYYSGRPAVPSGAQALSVLHTRDANRVYTALERENASFVLITAQMRTELFSRSDGGILFLLPNTERFVPIASDNDLTLWYYISRSRAPAKS